MVNVIGLGYIGLPTALMLASHGVEVVGTDYNKELVATLNEGKTTFKEDGLDELFAEAVAAGISTVVFDRCGAKYHGRIKALADAAREAGLKF